jgi:hypothetical protein
MTANWLLLTVANDHDNANLDDVAQLLLRCAREAPGFRAQSHVVRKPGRGDALRGAGLPTTEALAGLANGVLIMGVHGSIGLLSHARTARVDRNWARLSPLRAGLQLTVHLKELADVDVDRAVAFARGVAVDVAACLDTTDAELEWRVHEQNHAQDAKALLRG